MERTIPGETARRAGYDEVWMADPRMGFRCGDRTITMKRISGGGVQFSLIDYDHTPSPQYRTVRIRTEKQFNKMWQTILELGQPEQQEVS
ncbi:hypothetical protein D4R42_04455 [bacterium]|nr:MAG: hypothetical protein D4R42_04455 [bacterium]